MKKTIKAILITISIIAAFMAFADPSESMPVAHWLTYVAFCMIISGGSALAAKMIKP